MKTRPMKRLKFSKAPVSETSFVKALETQPLNPSPESALFKAAKTLGVVTTSVPVSISRLGTEHFITASVGTSFLVYDTEHLHVTYMSTPLSAPISALLSVGEGTLTAAGNKLQLWNKMVQVASLEGHTSDVHVMETVGGAILITASSSELCVWDLPRVGRDSKPLADPLIPSLKLDFGFKVTAIASIPTYVNKVLIGGAEGQLELWNVRSGKKLYSYTLKSTAGVSAIASSPALDIVAVGRANGWVSMLNLKTAEILFSFDQSLQGSVTSLAFVSLGLASTALVAGSASSAIVIYDLQTRRIQSILDSAHSGSVTAIHALSGLPMFVSSGSDNAITVWIFEQNSTGCRMLRERRGMSGVINSIAVYGENEVLVAGSAGVGKVSLIQNQQNQIFSQASIAKHSPGEGSRMPWKHLGINRLSPVTSLGFAPIRHFDWPAIVTAHAGHSEAFVWSGHQQALVTRMLIVPGNTKSEVSAVAVSKCGNFTFIGCDDGKVHKFNLQSCLHRGVVGSVGVRVRDLHIVGNGVIAVGGSNVVKIVGNQQTTLDSLSGCAIGDSSMSGFFLAVALRTGGLLVVDWVNDRIVRVIRESKFPVTAICWSPDGRLLFASDSEGVATVLDFAGGFVRDRLRFGAPVTSCCFSASGQLLTTHGKTGDLGCSAAVYSWQNLQYLDSSRPSAPSEPVLVGVSFDAEQQEDVKIHTPSEAILVDLESAPQVEMIGHEVLTLSDVPRTQLQTLLLLDEIKERNAGFEKSIAKPKEIPFFLPTVTKGKKTVFSEPDSTNTSLVQDSVSFFERSKAEEVVGKAGRLLTDKKYHDLFDHLKCQTSAGTYLCLAEFDGALLNQAVDFLAHYVESGVHADLVQTWLSVFLKLHGEELLGLESIGRLSEAVSRRDVTLSTVCNKVLCFSKVAASLQLLG